MLTRFYIGFPSSVAYDCYMKPSPSATSTEPTLSTASVITKTEQQPSVDSGDDSAPVGWVTVLTLTEPPLAESQADSEEGPEESPEENPAETKLDSKEWLLPSPGSALPESGLVWVNGEDNEHAVDLATITSIDPSFAAKRKYILAACLRGETDFDYDELSTLGVHCLKQLVVWLQTSDRKQWNLEGANLTHVNLRGTNLRGVNLEGANLSNTNLTDADLTDVNLRGANLRDANLGYVNLTGADLTGADLTGATPHSANLKDVNLTGVNLHRADLHRADLRDVDLTGVNLTGIDLTSADLTGQDLSGKDLRGADLEDVNLRGVNLAGVNLADVNLTGVNLTGVTISASQVHDLPYSNRGDVTIVP